MSTVPGLSLFLVLFIKGPGLIFSEPLSVLYQSTTPIPGNQQVVPWYVNKNYMTVEEHLVYGPGSRLIRGCEGNFVRKPCSQYPVTKDRCDAWKCCWDPNHPVRCAESRFIIYKLVEQDETGEQTCGMRPKDAGPLPKFGQTPGALIPGSENVVKQGDWPWMVYMLVAEPIGSSFQCGATIIHPKYALTAHHCLCLSYFPYSCGKAHIPASAIQMYVNEIDVREVTHFDIKYDVEDYFLHPDYNARSNSDIALVKLKIPANARRLATICVPPQGFDTAARFSTGPKCIAIGWGIRDVTSNAVSPILIGVALQVYSTTNCINAPSIIPVLSTESKICAGGVLGEDSCKGDSGGPLMCRHSDGRWYIDGIVSYGEFPCAQAGKPGIYTKVSDFTSWIYGLMD